MYKSDNLKQTDNETFTYIIDKHKDFKILQLTDLHLGFGFISRKKDKLALNAVTKIIHKAKPDMIVLTGDSIFPFLPKAGTLNNRKQAYKLMKFMDSFAIPYTLVFGNHDCEMGSTCNKEELAQIYKKGKYCIFTEGRKELTGVGNFFINLCQFFLITCRTHLAIMITKNKRIWNCKAVHEFHQLVRLLSVIKRSCLWQKWKYRISS